MWSNVLDNPVVWDNFVLCAHEQTASSHLRNPISEERLQGRSCQLHCHTGHYFRIRRCCLYACKLHCYSSVWLPPDSRRTEHIPVTCNSDVKT
jgi:hypothetical protein